MNADQNSQPETNKTFFRGIFQQSQSRMEDLIALNVLPTLSYQIYIPWTRPAMRPSSIMVLLNEVILMKRKTILEYGSGISTLYLAQQTQHSDTRIVSIDNNADWLKIIQDQMTSLGIDQTHVDYVHCPLSPINIEGYEGPWYDHETVRNRLEGESVDMVLVDGPVSDRHHPLVRFPALPVSKPFLAKDFCVYLDDCNREGEQTIAKRWSEAHQLQGAFLPDRGNICLFFPKGVSRLNVT